MSYNMIDFTLYDKLDCSAEILYHKSFATYEKYKISNIKFNKEQDIVIKFDLIHKNNEANNLKYAESVVKKSCEINVSKLYSTNIFESFFKGFEVLLNAYYILDIEGPNIVIHSKQKGKSPNPVTPLIKITEVKNVSFDFNNVSRGTDTVVYVKDENKSKVHLPITSFGKNYKLPKVNDRLIFIDSVENDRDRTFTRKVTNVKKKAWCTCDVLTLDLPIDRLSNNLNRIDGLATHRPSSQENNYTASFDKVQIFVRKDNYNNLLNNRGVELGRCTQRIKNNFVISTFKEKFINNFIENSENPHLSDHKINYFGSHFKWYNFEEYFRNIHDMYGEYLRDDLFLLTSNKNRPDYLVHIDYDHEECEKPVIASFTWPILNCNEHTTTVWYEASKNNELFYTLGKQDVVITDTTIKLQEIDRYTFNTNNFNSVIFKHNDWHTLYNSSEQINNRMLLQWRFKPDIPWNEVLNITKNLHV